MAGTRDPEAKLVDDHVDETGKYYPRHFTEKHLDGIKFGLA